jgi:hypothetical protein
VLLHRVGLDLVGEPYAAAFLHEVHNDAAMTLHEALRPVELQLAVALEAAKHLTGQTLIVHAHRHVFASGNVTRNHAHKLAAAGRRVGARAEHAK